MDQAKTGKFIAQLRKERGLTQRELADLLLISDKTVSKWECGGGMPEISLMLPLCKELNITVNELLCGKRLESSEYQKNAEENIMNLMKEKEEFKRKLILEVIVVFITLLAGISLLMVAGYIEMRISLKVILIVIAAVVMFGGIAVAATLEMTSGAYECPNCGTRFVPSVGAYMLGMHTLTRRHLKCPKCGKLGWCRRRASITPDEE